MTTLTRHHDIDIYHMNQPRQVVKGIVFANENEHGHAGYLALKGVVSSKEPDFRITSKLMGNITFNQTVAFGHVGWEGWFIETEKGTWAVININEWPTTALFPIEESKNTWIYAYPLVRDTLHYFAMKGAQEVLTLTNTAVHEALDPQEFAQLAPTDIISCNWNRDGTPLLNDTNGNSLFFTPPAWMIPHIAKKLGYNHANTVAVGYDGDEEINEASAETLLEYLMSFLNVRSVKDSFENAVAEMRDLTSKANEIRRQIEDLAKGKPPVNNGMWG